MPKNGCKCTESFATSSNGVPASETDTPSAVGSSMPKPPVKAPLDDDSNRAFRYIVMFPNSDVAEPKDRPPSEFTSTTVLLANGVRISNENNPSPNVFSKPGVKRLSPTPLVRYTTSSM